MLHDRLGRQFPYLRLSLTEACNFRCTYCLPEGYRASDKPTYLQAYEIDNLLAAMVPLGLKKVRFTGGEPTLRADLCEIVSNAGAFAEITTRALTTNGYRLARMAKTYAKAGINALNVSIDSLEPEKFAQITGHDRLACVLDGLKAAQDAGIESLKINAVWLKGINDCELDRFIDFSAREKICVRFIELMQTGDNLPFFTRHYLSADILRTQLMEYGFAPTQKRHDSGPAIDYVDPLGGARIGLIAPYAKDFCLSCNRLRITARGQLRLCLFGEFGIDLRPLMQSRTQGEELTLRIVSSLTKKEPAHRLHEGKSGLTPHLASTGG